MNADDMRRLALQMPEAEEKSHFGKAGFPGAQPHLCTLPDADTAVVKLTHEQQEMLAGTEPAIFAPVPGGWGRQGWTRVTLAAADELTLRSALLTAWRNVAPASLRKAFDVVRQGAGETAEDDRRRARRSAGVARSMEPRRRRLRGDHPQVPRGVFTVGPGDARATAARPGRSTSPAGPAPRRC